MNKIITPKNHSRQHTVQNKYIHCPLLPRECLAIIGSYYILVLFSFYQVLILVVTSHLIADIDGGTCITLHNILWYEDTPL